MGVVAQLHYDHGIDPFSTGKMVKKGNFNSSHDGKIIQGPVLEKEKGLVYEKLLDNQIGGSLFQDMRITYFNGIIPFVSLRFHDRESRFGNTIKATIEKVGDYLSREELNLIHHFCMHLGFEYGDLDMIRDRNDQWLCILDANPIPTLPPRAAIKPFLKQLMINKWAEAFEEPFLNR